MTHVVSIHSRKSGKSQALKDGWIAETQSFQRMARGDETCDSYEELAEEYDKKYQKGGLPKDKILDQ